MINLYLIESKQTQKFILCKNSTRAEKIFMNLVKLNYYKLLDYDNLSNRAKDKLNKFIKNKCVVIRITKLN